MVPCVSIQLTLSQNEWILRGVGHQNKPMDGILVNGASQGAITARGQALVLRRTGILSVRCRDIGRVAPAASFSSALGATPDARSLLVGRNGDRQQLGAASR
jgi:hypothetical protein